MQHFGWAWCEDVLHTPLHDIAAQQGFDVSAAWRTSFQTRVFNEDMFFGFDDMLLLDLDKAEFAEHVRQAQEQEGSDLFMFVLNRAVQHVEGRKKRRNCFAVHQTDRL